MAGWKREMQSGYDGGRRRNAQVGGRQEHESMDGFERRDVTESEQKKEEELGD